MRGLNAIAPSGTPQGTCLREAQREIQRYWGAHLYVRVVPHVTPCMDWRDVMLPTESDGWSREQLVAILLHEWGHRMISPVSPARAAVWRKVAEKEGLDELQAQLAVNVATDGWVDRFYLENRHWGELYLDGNQQDVAKVEERLRTGGSAPPKHQTAAGSLDRFLRVWTGFYHRLFREVGGRDVSGGLELEGEEIRLLDGLWEALYEGPEDHAERIRQAARLLGDWLPRREDGGAGTAFPHFHPFAPGTRSGEGLTDRIRAEAHRTGLGDADLEQIFGRDAVERLRRRAARLRIYARVVPAIRRFMARRARLAFTGYKPWHAGRPLRELDVVASFERSPILIPGFSTLARQLARRGSHGGAGSGTVVLVVDDSGSTDGAVLEREQEACFAVIAAARAFGDAVGCVAFGSEVTLEIAPTSRYDQVEDAICGLASCSGGTLLVPALQRGVELAGTVGAFTLMVMTDAELGDLDLMRTYVQRVPAAVRVVAFCFNETDAVRSSLGPLASRMRVLAASPTEPFAESALEEIYG